MGRFRRGAAVAFGTALALALAACSGDSGGGPDTGAAPAAPAAASGDAINLTGACPAKIVVQTDWFAESEYGFLYNLIGSDAKIDTGKKRITGSLVSGGKDTGVDVEVRFGGPAIGYEQVSAQMYVDKSINLGIVSTDEAIQNSASQPTRAVFAPFEVSPGMIMWDKSRHPNFTTLVDIGQTDTKVLYYETDAYMQYLLGAGILRRGQVDGSYDGSPSRWVAEDGKVAQAGFATSEPYIYKNELGDGHSYDVNLQLVNDTGYPVYGQALSVRTGDEAKLAGCLKKLVPIVQRSQADFMAHPQTANALIIKAVKADAASVWNYSPGLAAYAVQTMKNRALVSNGSNATIGDMEQSRVNRMIQILTPIYAGQKKPVKAGLVPANLFTNQYIDTSIGLK
ncbi:hypothetical protein [Frankia tisae]|uniref:hypothetical protein n=1 Tax=Frankia tisae TaxID=2950104 RepID=UPI0021C1933D|nr:hypothetical protein [Frankia tisae]